MVWEAPWHALLPMMIISMPWRVTWKLKSINISNTKNLKVEMSYISGVGWKPCLLQRIYALCGHIQWHAYSGSGKSRPLPTSFSTYQHITACDPVVVEGDRAYVTLRSGNTCGGTQDLLEVIDISDKYEPNRRLSSFSMTEPYGLGIDNGISFCMRRRVTA